MAGRGRSLWPAHRAGMLMNTFDVLIILLIIAFVLFVFLTIGGVTAPDRCAATFGEIVSFWQNYCNTPLPY
jgi:hypothetical protein